MSCAHVTLSIDTVYVYRAAHVLGLRVST